jgi:hypothetical protein
MELITRYAKFININDDNEILFAIINDVKAH